jgi:hypothetical protein
MAMVLVVCAVADTPIVPMGRQQPVKSHSSIKDLDLYKTVSACIWLTMQQQLQCQVRKTKTRKVGWGKEEKWSNQP